VRTCDDWTTHYNASAAAMSGRREAVMELCIMGAASNREAGGRGLVARGLREVEVERREEEPREKR